MYRKNRIICRNFERVELFLGSFAFSWEQRKLVNEVSSVDTGKSKFTSHESGKYEILGSTSVIGYDNSYDYEGDFLLTARVGANAGELYRHSGKVKISDNTVFIQGSQLDFIYYALLNFDIKRLSFGTGQPLVKASELKEQIISMPTSKIERDCIGKYFCQLDHLITLHQRKVHINTKRPMRLSENERSIKTISWEQRKLLDIAVKVTEKNIGRQYVETFTNSAEFGIISQRDFFDHDISKMASLDGYYIVRDEDFVYNPRISASAPVGPINRNKLGRTGVMSPLYTVFRPHDVDTTYLEHFFKSNYWHAFMNFNGDSGARSDRFSIKDNVFFEMPIPIPPIEEQKKIGEYLTGLDNLITLHQRKSPSRKNWRCVMIKETRGIDLFHEYYAKWITVYKKGAIRKVTMDKYLMTQKWLEKLIPDLRICDMNRIAYQQLLNDYAEHHERQTTMDFHHQLKGAILDAVDEGLIDRDPTRKAIIKGRTPMSKKVKYLNQFELHTLLTSLELKNEVNWDYFILLVAKTGMRFSEALALTPKDFDFSHQTLSINKTWDYKGKGGFQPTKNKSSIRKIQIDWQTVIQFSELVKGFPKDQPIFVKSNVYNSTVNDILGSYCERSNIPVISIHGLRHTHASLLLFAGVSIASVARRLGHSSMTTTQKTYLHIIQELENKDIDLVMRSLSGLS